MIYEKQIAEQYGDEYVIRQLAEEAAELCQAALKLVRAMRDETPIRQIDAQSHLLEEIADVEVMLSVMRKGVLTEEADKRIKAIGAKKFGRMVTRLIMDDALDND